MLFLLVLAANFSRFHCGSDADAYERMIPADETRNKAQFAYRIHRIA